MNIKKIKETCLYVKDITKSKDFYHRRLGFEVIGELEGRHVFFRVGSSVLLCFIAEVSEKPGTLPPHFGAGQLHLAFEVEKEQYRPWKQKVQNLGIPIEQEYNWGGGFLSFYFRDPDEHLLEIIMEGMWERG
ncbi:catechol 2,3-dioxygenase-like lactoylglutathione lyase family enzyme [Pontibacter mucosus]|uniref:Catechol 2,3-dioxygenase-like lactoylglutathione lyase family enzyme n=1 Tax=Pontibacter mucosus TaxID=1649266 RepID=A0A2T5YJA2_9BACT|nr:VOC family protein [Pontibacter mucosus]PTX19381.1 catechol 2,3-dioxygenase-like lactoylglutathione lyase family enzyme [Pontibacter mucosus]